MAEEIERKFLVTSTDWRRQADAATRMAQGYLSIDEMMAIRVRIEGEKATLNIKAVRGALVARDEYEYTIPLEDARELLDRHCRGRIVDKTRHRIEYGGLMWEVDEFHGDNAPLIVAEVELEEREQTVPLPDWVGDEVTEDRRYLNSYLSEQPYRNWMEP